MNLQFINAADLVGHWINGQADAGSGTRCGDVFNPAQGRVARQVALATRADVDRAVAAARVAFADWGSAAPQRRARVMFKFRDLSSDIRTISPACSVPSTARPCPMHWAKSNEGWKSSSSPAAFRNCSRASIPTASAAASTTGASACRWA
jgi:hypothetical protein